MVETHFCSAMQTLRHAKRDTPLIVKVDFIEICVANYIDTRGVLHNKKELSIREFFLLSC